MGVTVNTPGFIFKLVSAGLCLLFSCDVPSAPSVLTKEAFSARGGGASRVFSYAVIYTIIYVYVVMYTYSFQSILCLV